MSPEIADHEVPAIVMLPSAFSIISPTSSDDAAWIVFCQTILPDASSFTSQMSRDVVMLFSVLSPEISDSDVPAARNPPSAVSITTLQ